MGVQYALMEQFMTSKQSRLTEFIRQKALRVVTMLHRESLVAKQIDEDFDQQHIVTNFVKTSLTDLFLGYMLTKIYKIQSMSNPPAVRGKAQFRNKKTKQ